MDGIDQRRHIATGRKVSVTLLKLFPWWYLRTIPILRLVFVKKSISKKPKEEPPEMKINTKILINLHRGNI